MYADKQAQSEIPWSADFSTIRSRERFLAKTRAGPGATRHPGIRQDQDSVD